MKMKFKFILGAGRAKIGPMPSGLALLGVLGLALPLPASVPRGEAIPRFREVRVIMGTTAEIAAEGVADPRALDDAFAAVWRVDALMSLWKETELTALNRDGEGHLSADTLTVVRHALEVAKASGGAFDPTVEPLVRARGGYGGPPRQPSADETRQLLRRVGFDQVTIDQEGCVRLNRGGGIDLGGIAKGYAADLALAALRKVGARAGLVDLGGSSIGTFGAELTMAVRNPEDPNGEPVATFVLDDGAVATSGFDQRGEHVLDPRTGEPARAVLGTTIVASTGIEADALSTAVFVLGAPAGLALAGGRGAAALVLVRESGRAVLHTTPGFAERFRLRTALRVSDGRAVPSSRP
jgi:thiamine biosynthesis lipoprotein